MATKHKSERQKRVKIEDQYTDANLTEAQKWTLRNRPTCEYHLGDIVEVKLPNKKKVEGYVLVDNMVDPDIGRMIRVEYEGIIYHYKPEEIIKLVKVKK